MIRPIRNVSTTIHLAHRQARLSTTSASSLIKSVSEDLINRSHAAVSRGRLKVSNLKEKLLQEGENSLTKPPRNDPLQQHLNHARDHTSLPARSVASAFATQFDWISELKHVVHEPLPKQSEQAWRPMNAVERARRFPLAMWDLVGDMHQYKSIVDARNSHRNAWSRLEIPLNRSACNISDTDDRSHALSLFLPGFSPRQAFSRHFHNAYEEVEFGITEQNQRIKEFDTIVENDLCIHSSSILESLSKFFEFNESNEVLVRDPVGLYEALFEPSKSVFQQTGLSGFSCLEDLPDKYVRDLSLAMGVYQSLPAPYLNQFMARVLCPTATLRSKLRHILYRVVEDDAHLLVEYHEQHHCAFLTDQEVFDACLLRNLPIVTTTSLKSGPHAVNYQVMRRNLSHHLDNMWLVQRHVSHQMSQEGNDLSRLDLIAQTENAKERLGLFASHLSILKHHFAVHRNG